jgi:hypothetical protein
VFPSGNIVSEISRFYENVPDWERLPGRTGYRDAATENDAAVTGADAVDSPGLASMLERTAGDGLRTRQNGQPLLIFGNSAMPSCRSAVSTSRCEGSVGLKRWPAIAATDFTQLATRGHRK